MRGRGRERGKERGREGQEETPRNTGGGVKERQREEEGNIYNLVRCFHSDEGISGGPHLVFQVQLLCHCRTCVSVDTHAQRVSAL